MHGPLTRCRSEAGPLAPALPPPAGACRRAPDDLSMICRSFPTFRQLEAEALRECEQLGEGRRHRAERAPGAVAADLRVRDVPVARLQRLRDLRERDHEL